MQKIKGQEYVPGEDVAKALQRQKDDFRREIDELKKANHQQQQNAVMANLRSEYPDFDEIVNPETLAVFDETYPRLAQTIGKLQDPVDAAIMAYEQIKAKGILDKVPGIRRAKETEKRIEQNKKTVQSPSSFDKRPMAQAFQGPQTKEEKEKLYKEMMQFASYAGGGY